MSEIEFIPPKSDNKQPNGNRKPPVLGLIYAIAVIIIIVWLLGLLLHFAAWLIGALLPLAAIVIIAGLIYRFVSKK